MTTYSEVEQRVLRRALQLAQDWHSQAQSKAAAAVRAKNPREADRRDGEASAYQRMANWLRQELGKSHEP